MERRSGLRATFSVPVGAFVDGHRHACRTVDVSATGMLYERTLTLSFRQPYELNQFELRLGPKLVRVRARTVRVSDRLHAVKFIGLASEDKLTLAEHVDHAASDTFEWLH